MVEGHTHTRHTLSLAANEDVWAIKLALERSKVAKAGHMVLTDADGKQHTAVYVITKEKGELN